VFGDPLMADASEVNAFTAPEPGGREHDPRRCDGRAEEEPRFIHGIPPVADYANHTIRSV